MCKCEERRALIAGIWRGREAHWVVLSSSFVYEGGRLGFERCEESRRMSSRRSGGRDLAAVVFSRAACPERSVSCRAVRRRCFFAARRRAVLRA